jgi:hypothetical protein
MNWKFPQAKGFTPHPSLKIFFVVALFLTIAMSFTSNFDRHPDEIHHFEAANYYKNHFLPPIIDDPLIRDSYSTYGVSYLNYHWAEYFYAGKIMLLLSPFVSDPHLAARLSSVFLFAFLIAFFFYRSRQDKDTLIIPAFLLVTSQVWYVFNYINNDAFVLFISILTAYQIVYEKSLLNNFLQAKNFSTKIGGGLMFGFLTGLLLICKSNYYSFLLFAALWLFYKFFVKKLFFDKESDFNLVKKFVFIALIAVLILSFRCAMDFYVNGETNFVGASYISKYFGNLEKKGKLLEFQEQIADYNCKPSTVENDLQNSHPDLALKAKGIGLKEVFFKRLWFEYSLNSFVGGYGYMEFFAPRRIWQLMGLLYFLFGLYVVFAVAKSKEKESLIELAIFVFGVFLTFFVSLMLSWIYAFQPQGRYLFPVLAMFGVFVYSNRRHFHNSIVNGFIIVSFLLVAYSFAFVALPGINHSLR